MDVMDVMNVYVRACTDIYTHTHSHTHTYTHVATIFINTYTQMDIKYIITQMKLSLTPTPILTNTYKEYAH